MVRKLIFPAAIAGVVALFACATDHNPPPGELMVVVTSDMSIPDDVDKIGLEVQAFGNDTFKNEFAVGQGALLIPATMGVIAGQSPTTPVTIKVWARQAGVVRVLREVVTTVPGDRLALLTMPVQFLCVGTASEVPGSDPGSTDIKSTCATGQSCLNGTCVTNTVDVTKLPDYAPAAVFGGGNGDAATGTCFDTLGCFNGATAANVDLTTCTADMPADLTKVNYALNTTSKIGICNADKSFCVVPLDSGATGWFPVMTSSGMRVQLPAAACAQIGTKVLSDVLVTTSCGVKTTSQPPCGAWSSAGATTKPTVDASAAPSCTDGVKNGTETGTDCGGTCPTKCGTGVGCKTGADCASAVCTGSMCVAASCSDGVKNGAESDVDCGGTCPTKCGVGLGCSGAADCTTNICTSNSCGCPAGAISVSKHLTTKSAYCVDATEVTTASYQTFLNAAVSPSTQPVSCSTWNGSFQPGAGWNSSLGNLPVNFVNWCDAYAYCSWAGKRLCGNIAGGSNAPADLANASKSQWFNACSNGGANIYPYGTTFNAQSCNGIGYTGGGAPITVGGDSSCQGGTSGIFDMSGNVAEWEDSCAASAGPSDSCQARGGSYASQSADLACNANFVYARSQQDGSLGFRCCQD